MSACTYSAAEMGQEELEQFALLLTRGEVMACPTETSCALIADSENYDAIQRIYQIKNRGDAIRSH